MYGHVDEGGITHQANQARCDADPWGFNAIGSYRLNDCWELAARFAYVNSDEMGMTIGETFGCAPDSGYANVGGNTRSTLIASDTLFEKVYSGYVGINWYLMNETIKISFGLEQVKYKNRFSGTIGTDGTFSHGVTLAGNTSSDGTNVSNNKGTKVNQVRGLIQFLF